MKLLIVCDYSLEYLGGAQTALIRQADAAAAAGHDVFVLIPEASPGTFSPSVRVITPPPRFTIPHVELPLFRANDALRAFAGAVLAASDFDAVILHSEFGLASSFSEAARQLDVPVLHTVHTFFWSAPWIAAPAAPLARAFHRRVAQLPTPEQRLAARPFDSALRGMTLAVARTADVVVSPSAHQADRLRAAGLQNVAVLSNVTESATASVPLPLFDELRLAWIGRFSPEKRLDAAVGGVTAVNASLEHPIVRLDVAGGTPTKRLSALGGEAVTWHGRLPASEVADLVDSAHAVLITSDGFDNQPMVALEAFTRGRPVVVVDPALAREFGGAAILCHDASATGIARTLRVLASEPWRLEFAALDAHRAAVRSSAAAHVAGLEHLIDQAQTRLPICG